MNYRKKFLFLGVFFAISVSAMAQNIALRLKNVTVKKAMTELKQKSGYSFVYEGSDINVGKKVNVNASTVSQAVEQILAGQNVSYRINGKSIIVSKKVAAPSNQRVNTSQKERVSGTIVDTNGEPIIGATVTQKGTKNVAITDMNGHYTIDVPAGSLLEVSYIGFSNVQFAAGKHSTVTMREAAKSLDDVIVIGYGSTSSKKLVESVTAIKGESVQNLPFANVTSALQGRATGVIIQNKGGEPGSVPSISIRGGGDPLYVIDGVICSDSWEFQTLNPDDIESISILKDASALAIYGSRAADGIVLVKTKEGHKGKTSITYSFNAQFSQPTVLPDKMNSYEYASMQNDAAYYDGMGEYHQFSKEELDIIKNQTEPYKYPNTDWLSLGLKNFAPEYRHSVTITGNQKDINYFISGSAFDQGSLYKSDALHYKRYTLRSNVNTTFDKIGLRVALNINAALEKHQTPSFSSNSIWDHLNAKSPLDLAYNEDGTYSSISDHPLMEMDKNSGYYKNNGMYLNAQFVADWDLPWVKGLTLGTMLHGRLNTSHVKTFSARAAQYNQDGSKVSVSKPTLREDAYFGESYDFELNAAYKHTFADVHSLDAKVVFNMSENDGSYFWAYRKDFLSTAVDQMFAGASDGMQNSGNASEGGRMGFVGRLKYDYASRYYIEGSFRYDGSDNFAPGHRWGFFPSIAIAWDITEEPFFKKWNLKNVNLLKLRASYGKMGTESGVNRFGYLATYELVEKSINIGGKLQSGFAEGNLVDPSQLTWYNRTSLNYGIDFAFFGNRLKGTADYFFYVTKGGLMSPADQYITPLGTKLPQIKSDTEHRREGMEMNISWSDKLGSGFSYEVGTNMTLYNNLYVVNEGESLSTLKNPWKRSTHHTDYYGVMYLDEGLYQSIDEVLGNPRRLASSEMTLGDIRYKDLNGDGKIDSEDQTRYGMPSSPHLTYGVDFSLGYKGFSLSGLFYGTGKRNMMMGVNWISSEATHVVDKVQLDYWTEDNRDAVFPRLSLTSNVNGGNNTRTSSFWLKNAAFLRLKNLSLSYDFKYKLLRKSNWINKCSLSLSGTNLFTISGVTDYFDPETTSTNGGYPLQRVYSIGLTIGF